MEQHPEVTVLDPPEAAQRLCNRQSMLQDVANLSLADTLGKAKSFPKKKISSHH